MFALPGPITSRPKQIENMGDLILNGHHIATLVIGHGAWYASTTVTMGPHFGYYWEVINGAMCFT